MALALARAPLSRELSLSRALSSSSRVIFARGGAPANVASALASARARSRGSNATSPRAGFSPSSSEDDERQNKITEHAPGKKLLKTNVAVSQWPPPPTNASAPFALGKALGLGLAYVAACYGALVIALAVMPAIGFGSAPNARDVIGAFPRGALTFPTDVPAALRFMDLFGTAMYAHAGTITAGTRGMDLMGCLVVGCVTAMSGGTMRQVLTGETPVFWCAAPEYLATALASSAFTFWLWPKITADIRLSREMNAVLNVTDALALGCFTVVGANAAHRLGLGVLVGVACGVITSCSGGILRDICCAQPIRIMHSHQELYATCVAAGSLAFLLVANRAPEASVAARVIFPIALVVVLRLASWTFNLVLPLYADRQPFQGVATRVVL